MRRLVTTASLAYVLVAFGFILLTILNASDEGEIVYLLEADAGVIVALSSLGIFVTGVLGIRILMDGKERRDLERQVYEPRRKSDVVGRDTPPS